MAQLSRPYQIALVAVAALALLWFAVLRSHGAAGGTGAAAQASGQSASSSSSAVSRAASGASGSSASGASSAATAAAEAKQAATPTPEYHGSAPGMKGLSRAVRKAHEAVGASQGEAAAIESAASQSGTSTGTGGGVSTATTGGTAAKGDANSPTSTSHSGVQAHSPAGSRSSAGGQGSSTATAGHLSRPARIAHELRAGKVVLLLFWNPQSAEDVSVRHQLHAVSHDLKGKVAVHCARAREVGSFGTVTRNISVYQTPTLLVIGHKGLVTTITGLTDSFAIEQAIREGGG